MSGKPIDNAPEHLLDVLRAMRSASTQCYNFADRVEAALIADGERRGDAQQQGQAPPPSAPVVDEAMTRRIMADFHANDPGDVWPPDEQGRLRRQALQDAINKHLAASPALAQQPAAGAVDEAMVDRACDAYVQIADDCMGLVRRKAMAAALTAALATQRQEPKS